AADGPAPRGGPGRGRGRSRAGAAPRRAADRHRPWRARKLGTDRHAGASLVRLFRRHDAATAGRSRDWPGRACDHPRTAVRPSLAWGARGRRPRRPYPRTGRLKDPAMSRPHLLDALRDRVLLCDGGMGSRVQAMTLDVEKDYWAGRTAPTSWCCPAPTSCATSIAAISPLAPT